MRALMASKLILGVAASTIRGATIRIVTGRAANPVEKIIEQALFDLAQYAYVFITKMLAGFMEKTKPST